MALLTFNDFEIDLDRYELRRNGHHVRTEPQVFDVLVYLASHAGRLVTKEELLDTVWGDRFVSESALTSRIKAARQSIGDDGQRQAVIATVHSRGYRMVVPVHKLSDPAPVAAVVTPAESLVERDDALADLGRALAAAAAGSGRVACVSGEAGIGKTALIQRMAETFAERATVLIGSCDDLSTPRPMAPLHDVAAALRTTGHIELADLRPERLLEAICDLSQRQRVAIVFEDLHWADDGTLDAVRYMFRRIRSWPLLLVLTYRQEDLSLSHPLRRLLGVLRGPEVVRIELQPLTRSGVAELLSDHALSADELHAVTGGNPFFVTELVAARSGTVPQTVKDAVLARLAQLADGTVAALRRLSVVPGRVERWLASSLADNDSVSLATAERAGMLDGAASHVWFRHELARWAVEQTLTPSERVQSNHLAATHLAEHGADASRVMHHATLADAANLVVETGPSAAAAAISAGSHRQAVDHLAAVLRHADLLEPAQRAALLVQQANSLYLVNRFEDSLRAAEQAVDAARELQDATAIARAELALARTVLWARGPNASRLAAERALDALGQDGEPELRGIAHADLARALGELATIGSIAEGSERALAQASQALALAQQLQRHDLVGYALTYLGCARLALGDAEGEADLEDAISHLRQFPRTELAVRACVNAAGAAYRSARFESAERYVELGLQLAKDTEFHSGGYRLALTRAEVRFSCGRWEPARRELEALLAQTGEPGIMGSLARTVLARLCARTGEHVRAAAVLEPALAAAAASDEVRLVGPVTIASIELAWLAGRDEDLLMLASPVLHAPTMPGSTVNRAEVCRYLQRAGVSAPEVPGCPEPWRSALAGDWRGAASQWQARGEPYEQALELLAGGDPDAGIAILRDLGATGTTQRLMPR